MPKQVIVPPGSPPPLAPYSPGTRAGNVIYTSRLLPLDQDGKLIGEGDIKAQTRAVLENIRSVLETAGGTLSDYGEYFKQDPPARYCIRSDLVKPEFLVEIQCIAHLSR